MSKRLSILAFAVLAIGLIAGCGSSDDSTTGGTDGGETSTASITKAELIKQGDQICEQGNESIESEADEFAEENDIDTSKPTTAQQEEVISGVVAPNIRAQGEEISALGAPSGDEAAIEEIVAAVEKGADELETEPDLLLEEGGNPLGEGTKLAKEYGFKVCGEE